VTEAADPDSNTALFAWGKGGQHTNEGSPARWTLAPAETQTLGFLKHNLMGIGGLRTHIGFVSVPPTGTSL